MKQFTLNKKERVKKRKDIEALFNSGKTFAFFPLRAYYLLENSIAEEPLQFGCGVSKKHFKKSVDRNRIKRLMREVFRVEKGFLKEELIEKGLTAKVFVIFTGKELPDFNSIKEKMLEVISLLQKNIKEYN